MEVEAVPLLDGEVAAPEELATTGTLAAAFGVDDAMAVVEVMVGDWAGFQEPPSWFRGTASARGEAARVSSRRLDGCMMTGMY